jgi:hypothetical protein
MKKIYNVLSVFILIIMWSGISAQAPYCVPAYTVGCQNGDGLTAFQLENINQEIACDGSPDSWYHYYADTTDLTIGEGHMLQVYVGTGFTYISLWIDFNDNDVFDYTEEVINGLVIEFPNMNYVFNLFIPANAPAGLHRMRYRTNLWSPPVDPCVSLVYGNSADFMVNLVPPPPPGNAVLDSPSMGASGILPAATLNWTPGAGSPPAGYYVFLGTDNTPTNLVNGAITTIPYYNPFPDLLLNTTYYWKIVPFNSGGQATAAPVWSFTTIAGYGVLQGYANDAYGVPVSGVAITASGPATYTILTDATGFYQFPEMLPGIYTLTGQANSYNPATLSGIVVNEADTTNQNLLLLQPNISVLPSPLDVTLSPNEELQNGFVVSNTGNGMLSWTATISYGSTNHDWFTMPVMNGDVNPSTNSSIPAEFNADGLIAGTVENATVTFTSVPDVETVIIPISLTVAGPALVPVTNVQAILTNALIGSVNVSWECLLGSGFLYYTVKRNGIQVAVVPSNTYYSDVLPDYGSYTYCVNAVYADGNTVEVCTAAEWANPNLVWTPAALSANVWSNTSKTVNLVVGNTGIGLLAFEFPDYVDHAGDNPLAYCPAQADSCDEYIGNVNLGTINNPSSCGHYTDYSAIIADLVRGETYPMTVTNGGNAYSSDYLYVWIDFDHNNIFDASELTQLAALGGGLNFSGSIVVPATALPGLTAMRVRLSYATSANPCGTQSYGEVEDYSINIKEPTFVTSVVPASGMVAAGATINVHLEFSATGSHALPGIYTTLLNLASNDMNHQSVNIPCTMIVGLASFLEGVVTDCATGEPIPGVMVNAGVISAMTNDTGYYSMLMYPGTYNVVFSKIGYQSVNSIGVVIAAGDTTILNSQMCEQPYPPACAYASVNFEDTECTVTWCLPAGPYEMIYDDGIAENSAGWLFPGNMNAVKFTPQGYPAKITGARFMIGDGWYGNSLGSTFGVLVCKADAAGLPGIVLDSIEVSVLNTGWLTVSGLNATITIGDFFIVMVQNSPSPDCPYLGVDETLPLAYKSYSRNISNGDSWGISPYQDFMIRAIVSGPVSGDDDKVVTQIVVPAKMDGMISKSPASAPVGSQRMNASISIPEGFDSPAGVYAYAISRFFLGSYDPIDPSTIGNSTLINNSVSNNSYTEALTTWSALAQGWYAYGIIALYPDGQQSEFTYTNPVPHKMFADLTLSAQLECESAPAEGAIIKLTGMYYPYDELTAVLPATGNYTFSHIIKGEYLISVTYPGYETNNSSVSVQGNQTAAINLLQTIYKPENLAVDAFTLVATWHEPQAYLLNQDFESGIYPPDGWQTLAQGTPGWYFTNSGSSAALPIPSHTTYAVTNDDQGGATNDGCCDYLFTPEINLTGAEGYKLSFQSFYNGNNGQLATIEMITDTGWIPVYTCTPSSGWQQVEIDLSAYSGNTGMSNVKFVFHADDGGNQASGWAVDDITIGTSAIPVLGYKVYLDGALVGEPTLPAFTFDPLAINYGQTYLAGVTAVYCTGESDHDTVSFSSAYLYPPQNLVVDTSITSSSGAAILTWEAPLPGCATLVGYNIYRNDVPIAQVPATVFEYWDTSLMPGSYCYSITALGDITGCGYTGVAESVKEGPVCTDIIYGMGLPFFEGFASGEFDTTMWNAGQNWLIDDQSDNPVPAAKFKWDPPMVNYSSSLQSNWINATTLDSTLPMKIWFDYEIKLENQSETSTEKLTIEVWDGTSWNVAKEYLNDGSFDWKTDHLDITGFAMDQLFKVRFRANGNSSDGIQYWAVDNIEIYIEVLAPGPLNLVAQQLSTSGNDIQLTWDSPFKSTSQISCSKYSYSALRSAIHSNTKIIDMGSEVLRREIKDSVADYTIYRRDYAVFPPGQNSSNAGEWTQIATVSSTEYLDQYLSNLSTNCYEYYVTTVYTVGESLPSNIDWECIFVGLKPAEADEVSIYPNPANANLSLEFPPEIISVSIINATGQLIFNEDTPNQPILYINTSSYLSGIYSIRFTTAKGDSFIRKLVVVH